LGRNAPHNFGEKAKPGLIIRAGYYVAPPHHAAHKSANLQMGEEPDCSYFSGGFRDLLLPVTSYLLPAGPVGGGPCLSPYLLASTTWRWSTTSSAGGTTTTSPTSTWPATSTPTSAGPSSMVPSRPTTPWACTTPGAAATRTSTTASGPCEAASC